MSNDSPAGSGNKSTHLCPAPLRAICSDFVSICQTALQINGRMICTDQRDYQASLRENYDKLCAALAALLGDDTFLPDGGGGGGSVAADGTGASTAGGASLASGVHRQSMALFSAISGAPNNSSSA